ncbi:PREDICTED: uncharacterized protein LOC104817133 [Tarenaya hassleriana]|uniref:uncharacterized protein LOC104817133 n=1 Tax=Tarenaya hassleriana TaxID=28532 RepID=UPI00053C6A04|nr:PREDICTED: uncharacterized protein LOC104817133 [Tarenaya hassleriana]
MEPAKIDWKRIDSRFVEDVLYEHIQAPKWFDFLSPDDYEVDADAWFCRPDCDHAKRAEDFLTFNPVTPKLPSSGAAARDMKQSDAKSRKNAQTIPPSTPNNDHSENQNPNFATPPPSHQTRSWRSALKSSSVKKTTNTHDKLRDEAAPRLKSTLSARNLFAGRDILGHISEFCHELKRLATRVTEREEAVVKPNTKKTQVGETNEHCSEAETEARKQRTPLMEVGKEKLEEMTERGSSGKEKRRRKKRADEAENIIPMAMNLENVKNKGEELSLLQIRTNPPSPQCFSATKAVYSKKPSRSKPMV